MGIPQDFSYQLPARCIKLIDSFEDCVPTVDGGPLRTTFLLAMAVPLITIPDQVINGGNRLVMGAVNRLQDDVDDVMDAPFSHAPFRAAAGDPIDKWCYVPLPEKPNHPDDLEKMTGGVLNEDHAHATGELKTRMVLHQIRNALSHAGVIYLDAKGRYSPGGEAKVLAFISEGNRAIPYHVLAVTEEDFSRFLRRWADWLESLGMNELKVI